MTPLTLPSWRGARALASRRSLLQGIAAGALAALPLAHVLDVTEAGKKRKKSRRKKKRKNVPPDIQVRADATCPGPQDNIFTAGSITRLAQSFMAGVSGDLVRVELGINNQFGSDTNYVLRLAQLVDGLPGDFVLASAQVAKASLPDGITTGSFTFPSPARVVAGTSYALVLTVDGPENFSWISRDGNACGGRSFDANGLSAPFELRNDQDFVFTTFVQV